MPSANNGSSRQESASPNGSLDALRELEEKVRGLQSRIANEILRRQYQMRQTETGSKIEEPPE